MRVAVVGAAGYAGIEAVRWVLAHPRLELACVTSSADAGKAVSSVYPQLAGATDAVFREPDSGMIADGADIALLAVPHTAALGMAPALLDAGLTVIDLSADYRLADPEAYQVWYGTVHTSPELLESAVYGLPELDRSTLPGARLVACPGCYPTAATLAALPVLESDHAVGTRIIVDAKSGVSGAGRASTLGTHFCTVNESLAPYKVGAHRHTPEMEQAMGIAAGRELGVLFTPHLVPTTRGLLATVYIDIKPGFSTVDAVELYRQRYDDEPFITVHDAGSMPATSEVTGTNRASIGVAVDAKAGVLIAACAIDNLGKGAAGQAVQCLNAVLGYPETEGLISPTPVV